MDEYHDYKRILEEKRERCPEFGSEEFLKRHGVRIGDRYTLTNEQLIAYSAHNGD